MLYIILIIIIVIFALIIKQKEEPKQEIKVAQNETLPYRKKNLFTKSEYKFYMQLNKISAEENLTVFPKVRLEDFIEVTTEESKAKLKYRGHIKSRHVDFLICNEKLNILAAIELDDASHNTKKARETDSFKDKLYSTIKIPLYRITPGSDYNAVIENIIKAIKTETVKENA